MRNDSIRYTEVIYNGVVYLKKKKHLNMNLKI